MRGLFSDDEAVKFQERAEVIKDRLDSLSSGGFMKKGVSLYQKMIKGESFTNEEVWEFYFIALNTSLDTNPIESLKMYNA